MSSATCSYNSSSGMRVGTAEQRRQAQAAGQPGGQQRVISSSSGGSNGSLSSSVTPGLSSSSPLAHVLSATFGSLAPRSSLARGLAPASIPLRDLRCPPSWPQMQPSRIQGIPPLKSLHEWQQAPPLNANGRLVKVGKGRKTKGWRRQMKERRRQLKLTRSTYCALLLPSLVAQIAYAISNNSDHDNAYHYLSADTRGATKSKRKLQQHKGTPLATTHLLLCCSRSWPLPSPEDVTGLIGWKPFVHASRYRRVALSMEWEDANPHSASADGEYCLVEANALPFYLQHIFADHFGLFELVTIPLRLLESLLDELPQWRNSRERQDEAEEGDQHAFRRFWNAVYEEKQEACESEDDRAFCNQELAAVKRVWSQLQECDICVLPSVLLMDIRHTANEWSETRTSHTETRDRAWTALAHLDVACSRSARYDLLRMLEAELNLTVFPFIDVESRMENKVSQAKQMLEWPL